MKQNVSKLINKNLNSVYLLLMLTITSAFLFSCAPKTAVIPASKMITADYLTQGKVVFENSCARCHDLPAPTEYNPRDWVGIMNEMAPQAKLTEDQHQMVYDYIVSMTKS